MTHLLRVLLAYLLLILPSLATTYQWNGTGNWNDPTKWNPNGVPGSADRATFVSGVGGVCSVTTSQQVGSISGTGTVNLTTGNLYVGFDDTDTFFAGAIAGAGGSLWKKGRGTLTLAGACTFGGDFGAVTVDAGTLTLNGSLGCAYVYVSTGATLNGSGAIYGDYDYAWMLEMHISGTLTGHLNVDHECPYVEVMAGGTLGGSVHFTSFANGPVVAREAVRAHLSEQRLAGEVKKIVADLRGRATVRVLVPPGEVVSG